MDLNELNHIIKDEIKSSYQDPDIIETLLRTSNLIINENYFQFNNKVYKQKTRVPMGSPISGILAEIKVRKLEEIIKKKR